MRINSLHMISRRHALAALTCGALALWAVQPKLAQAQVVDWPQKPIKLVVPYAPGGSADTLGRLIAKHLGEAFRQPIVIEKLFGPLIACSVRVSIVSPGDWLIERERTDADGKTTILRFEN